MFGNSGPLINRLEARLAPQAPPTFPSYPVVESPRPSTVDQMLAPTDYPVSIEKALATIAGAVLLTVSNDDPEAKEMYRDWQALSERVKVYLQSRKDSHLSELRKREEELTFQGREVLERITVLRGDLGGIQSDYNIAEERRSQLALQLQALGPDPARRNDPNFDPDENFILPDEIAQWRARVAEARAKLETQQAVVSGVRERLQAKQEEINTVLRELATIKSERKNIRTELSGKDRPGPFGIKGRTGHV